MKQPWPLVLRDLLEAGPCVMVTIAAVKGSAPREPGARMLVTEKGLHGSIGGGSLEMRALVNARRLLMEGRKAAQHNERVGLGPALNQCCGGSVSLLYEYCQPPGARWLNEATATLAASRSARLLSAIDSPVARKWAFESGVPAEVPSAVAEAISASGACTAGALSVETAEGRFLLEELPPPCLVMYLFGAGHVGKATERALQPLPFDIHWVDSRRSAFPANNKNSSARRYAAADPVAVVRAADPDSLFLVMTHSHQQDEDICHAVLSRNDFRWLGLIGSKTKAMRFRHRLAQRGIPGALLERLECPVGLPSVAGKRPATIAVSVAARLLAEQVPAGWK